MQHLTVPVTEFKAKCPGFLTQIDEQGITITVTKRGRAIARVEPVARKPFKSPRGDWKGKVEIVGDIVNWTADWNIVREVDAAQKRQAARKRRAAQKPLTRKTAAKR